jgi:hypothetical protein
VNFARGKINHAIWFVSFVHDVEHVTSAIGFAIPEGYEGVCDFGHFDVA